MPEKRNIVLITLDSVRADHCSFMGYHRKTTPNIDKMAKKGHYFENAITAGIGTPASMTCTFTGDYAPIDPRETRPAPWRKVLSRRKTLAQVLSENGYHTGAIHLNPFVSRYFGFDKGFDYFQDFLSDSKGVFNRLYHMIFEKTIESRRTGIAPILRNIRNLLQKEEIFRPWESYYEDIIDWVERAKQPFFLWILLLDTHHPYIAPRKFRRYSNLLTMWYSNWKLQRVNWENKITDRERRWLINAYDDSIYYADSFVKNLWDDLKDLDPIFIIHADHGEGFGEHGFYGHQSFLYEEIIHIPLVIYNADVSGRIEKPVSLLGLAPTVLELIGEENRFSTQGFLNKGKDWVISEITENNAKKIAVRMKDWKFITGQKDEDELYYLKEDPYERENVIKEHPKLSEEMRNIVKSYVKRETERRKVREKISRAK